jgi:AraC-like DNA-binding protein
MDKEKSPVELLPRKSNLGSTLKDLLPLTVYTVGTEIQPPITRMKGFSAHQLFFTVSGTGKFRRLDYGKDKWDMLESGDLLYIPADCAHEYMATGGNPWHVAYVTFLENFGGIMANWGLRDAPRLFRMEDKPAYMDQLHNIWTYSGSEQDPWRTTELLMSLLLSVMKANQTLQRTASPSAEPSSYSEPIVNNAVQFIHDHLNRPITIAQLAEHVGYSQKQLTRLFRKELGTTPLQYVHRKRLHTASLLLTDNPELNVRQVAAYVGMEPEYFTRLYKRAFHSLPSAKTR